MKPREAVVIAAYQRGWSLKKIALAADVSWQAIQQTLAKNHVPRHRPALGLAKQHTSRCDTCGSVFLRGQRRKDRAFRFCSQLCANDSRKTISDDDVRLAIQMRFSNQTWTGIARALKAASLQRVQRRIWHRLFLDRMLTPDIVDRIWRPVPGIWQNDYSVAHVERHTGIMPSKTGGIRIAGWSGRGPNVDRFKSQKAEKRSILSEETEGNQRV